MGHLICPLMTLTERHKAEATLSQIPVCVCVLMMTEPYGKAVVSVVHFTGTGSSVSL